jgi:hypothetical protein
VQGEQPEVDRGRILLILPREAFLYFASAKPYAIRRYMYLAEDMHISL